MIYCFDLDGVVAKDDELKVRDNSTEYHDSLSEWSDYQWMKYFRNCEPNLEVVELIKSLKLAGHTIKFYTARPIKQTRSTILWLEDHQIPYDYIKFNKPSADVFIDDRAVRFESVDKLIKVLEKYK